MILIKEIQELINSINHNTSMGKCYMSGNSIQGIKEAIIRSEIDKLVFENDLFYCSQEENQYFFQELRGQVYNELRYRYHFSIKNKKTIFKKLVSECIIKELTFYNQDRKQTFFDMKKLLKNMLEHGFEIKERKYIKLKHFFNEYEASNHRSQNFRTVQSFKKWLKHYIPCDISKISVKKVKDKYIVSSSYLISIPYKPISIKGLDIELKRIDTELHRWNKIYEITNYKNKKLHERVYRELSRLNKLLEKKYSQQIG